MFGKQQKKLFSQKKSSFGKKNLVWVSFVELDYNQIQKIKAILREKSKS